MNGGTTNWVNITWNTAQKYIDSHSSFSPQGLKLKIWHLILNTQCQTCNELVACLISEKKFVKHTNPPTWRPSGMHVRGLSDVGRPVQKVLNLWPYTLAIMEQQKCWELLAQKYDRFKTLGNNSQQHVTKCNRVCKQMQHSTSNNVESCWPTMVNAFAWC